MPIITTNKQNFNHPNPKKLIFSNKQQQQPQQPKNNPSRVLRFSQLQCKGMQMSSSQQEESMNGQQIKYNKEEEEEEQQWDFVISGEEMKKLQAHQDKKQTQISRSTKTINNCNKYKVQNRGRDRDQTRIMTQQQRSYIELISKERENNFKLAEQLGFVMRENQKLRKKLSEQVVRGRADVRERVKEKEKKKDKNERNKQQAEKKKEKTKKKTKVMKQTKTTKIELKNKRKPFKRVTFQKQTPPTSPHSMHSLNKRLNTLQHQLILIKQSLNLNTHP